MRGNRGLEVFKRMLISLETGITWNGVISSWDPVRCVKINSKAFFFFPFGNLTPFADQIG